MRTAATPTATVAAGSDPPRRQPLPQPGQSEPAEATGREDGDVAESRRPAQSLEHRERVVEKHVNREASGRTTGRSRRRPPPAASAPADRATRRPSLSPPASAGAAPPPGTACRWRRRSDGSTIDSAGWPPSSRNPLARPNRARPRRSSGRAPGRGARAHTAGGRAGRSQRKMSRRCTDRQDCVASVRDRAIRSDATVRPRPARRPSARADTPNTSSAVPSRGRDGSRHATRGCASTRSRAASASGRNSTCIVWT